MDPDKRLRLLDGLCAIPDWTLVFVSQVRAVLERVDRVLMLDDGEFVETSVPAEFVDTSRLGRFLDGSQVREV